MPTYPVINKETGEKKENRFANRCWVNHKTDEEKKTN